MESKTIGQEWDALCQCPGRQDVIFYYVGYFSQNIISAMAEAVKTRIEYVGAEGMTRRKLFSSFVEMAQNIIHYSADFFERVGHGTEGMRHGSVCISAKGEHYFLHCANPVKIEIAERLRERLEHVRSLTIDEIKREYKATLRAETPEDSKGAGLGLLTMARDASAPLEFEFTPASAAGNVMFYLKATI
ncbi:SiaB family protein kinase [Herbaspirillum sp. RTI4]|nr:SiaB family protein kinase [Herbaspirillum sp. RTI4]MDY7578213.1 SiaB family protein kinase [Herbaspirillum sp. RTI4]MEA9981551.1 SiaB family protein kinase [Herbaspirillum sp. RTI4]